MTDYTLLSWNVNGIRAVAKKEVLGKQLFVDWIKTTAPDILCLQETKAQPEQVPKNLLKMEKYFSYWHSAVRKGYSSVGTICKKEPLQVTKKIGIEAFDNEGRILITEFPEFVLLNVYFPNGKKNEERLKYKLEFYDTFLEYINNLRKEGKSVVFCGDVNTAHKAIDLARPKANEKISGFLPIERAWIDKVIENGYIDTLRFIKKDIPGQYSWWSYRARGARTRNVGWRLDYFFVSEDLKDKIVDAFIAKDILGSDHCPVGLKLSF